MDGSTPHVGAASPATAGRHALHDDPYATRDARPTRLVPRLDPVLHGARGSAEPGPLARQQLEALDRDGFLVLPALLPSRDVADLLAALAALRDGATGGAKDGVIRERGTDEVRSIFAVHRREDALGRIARDPRIAGIARQVLGAPLYVHQSRVNLKPGFVGRAFAWHSDFETWHAEDGMPRMRALSASILLGDNHAWNGPLMLVPGSHRTFVSCPEPTPARHFERSLVEQTVGIPSHDAVRALFDAAGRRIELATGPAGTVVLFDCNTLHASGSNLSPCPRSNVFLVYNALENRLRAPYAAPEPRPDFLATRDPDPIA